MNVLTDIWSAQLGVSLGPGQGLLQVTALSVHYGSGALAAPAVGGASMSIDAGEAVGLLGESGCGKSTLARAILGMLPRGSRVEGSIKYRGKELTSASDAEMCAIRGGDIALISQDPAQTLNPVLTVGAQVSEVLRSHISLPGAERKQRVIEILRSVGFASPEQVS